MRPFSILRSRPQRMVIQLLALMLLAGEVGGCANDQETGSRATTPSEAVQYASPELAVFEMYIGVWTIAENHFSASGEVLATVNGTERITWALDNHAIQRVYMSGSGSSVYRAMGMLTWNAIQKKYAGVWFDNVATAGPLQVKGDWAGKDLTMTYTLESSAKDGPPQRYRVVERFVNGERRVAATYLPGGVDAVGVKTLEIEYRRATPCPGGVLRVIGELQDKPSQ